MFVKIENYYGENKHLILNTENIVAVFFDCLTGKKTLCPCIKCSDDKKYLLSEEQYEQLLRVLR